jgi:hypothetical protein
MIEGLWSLGEGSVVRVEFTPTQTVTGQVRWSRENRVGIEFHTPLRAREDGTFTLPRAREG